MTSANQSIDTCITYGNQKLWTDVFNEQTSIDEIHRQIRNLFGNGLPSSYYIKIYCPAKADFIILNQNVLDYECNPFSSINNGSIENIFHFVDLYVVKGLSVNFESATKSSIYLLIVKRKLYHISSSFRYIMC